MTSTFFFILVFVILPTVTAPLGFPVGVFGNLFGRHKGPVGTQKRREEFLEALKLKHTYSQIQIFARDNVKLCADYVNIGSKKTVILVHGYRSCPYVNFKNISRAYLEQGYNVLFAYQRALGISGGRWCGMGLKEQHDILKWVEWLETNTGCKNIVVHGASMGASSVGYASNKFKGDSVKALVFDSGYTSCWDQMVHNCGSRKFLRFVVTRTNRPLARFFARVDIKKSTEDCIKETSIPMVFVYGEKDATIPFIFVEKCYTICSAEKKLIVVPEATHIKGLEVGGPKVQKEFFDFINNHTKE